MRTHCCGDTLADTNVSPFSRARNICSGHKFCVRDTKNVSDFVQKHFVSATNVSQFAQPKKHHEQQSVRNNVSSFDRAFSHFTLSICRWWQRNVPRGQPLKCTTWTAIEMYHVDSHWRDENFRRCSAGFYFNPARSWVFKVEVAPSEFLFMVVAFSLRCNTTAFFFYAPACTKRLILLKKGVKAQNCEKIHTFIRQHVAY